MCLLGNVELTYIVLTNDFFRTCLYFFVELSVQADRYYKRKCRHFAYSDLSVNWWVLTKNKQYIFSLLLFCFKFVNTFFQYGRHWNRTNTSQLWALYNPWAHGLNMELDLQSLFGLLCTAVLISWEPATPPLPPHLGSYIYEGAIGQPR